MGYKKPASSYQGYKTKQDAEAAGVGFGGFQAIDKQWYDTAAFDGYSGQGKTGRYIQGATPAMQAQWEAEEREAARAAADAEVAETNRAKEAQMASLLDIQKRAMETEKASEEARIKAEQDEVARTQQVEAERQRQLNQDALTAANKKTDLLSENLPNVVAGGSADQFASVGSDIKKKKNGGLSTSLGINV